MLFTDITWIALAGAFILILTGIVFGLRPAGRRDRWLSTRFSPLVDQLGFSRESGGNDETALTGAWTNHRACIRFRCGRLTGSASLSFELDHPLAVRAAAIVRRRKWRHRIVRAGVLRHVSGAGGRFHVDSRDDVLGATLAVSDGFREAVLPLLDYPGAVVTIEPAGACLTLRRCRARTVERVVRLEAVESIFQSLTKTTEWVGRIRTDVPASSKINAPRPHAHGS